MWFRVDDKFHSHPKLVGASDAAVALWTLAGSWSSDHRTGGYVRHETLPTLRSGDVQGAAQELVRRGLWRRAVGGYAFHQWAERNPIGAQALAADDHKRLMRALNRRDGLLQAVRDRDGSTCGRCSAQVSFHDRRSETGGTYALRDASGAMSVDNVIVSCRGCVRRAAAAWGQLGDKPGDKTANDAPDRPDQPPRSTHSGAEPGQVGSSPEASRTTTAPAGRHTSAQHPRRSTPTPTTSATWTGARSDLDQTYSHGSLARSTSSSGSVVSSSLQNARADEAFDPGQLDNDLTDDRYAVHRPRFDEQQWASS